MLTETAGQWEAYTQLLFPVAQIMSCSYDPTDGLGAFRGAWLWVGWGGHCSSRAKPCHP